MTKKSGFRWQSPGGHRVPIDLLGSGARTNDVAAEVADRLTIAVGAELDRRTGPSRRH
jgi:hypothetical protein